MTSQIRSTSSSGKGAKQSPRSLEKLRVYISSPNDETAFIRRHTHPYENGRLEMFNQSPRMRTLLPLQSSFRAIGVGPATGYVQVREHLFPAPVKVGNRSFVPSDELEAVLAARIAGQSETQIRELVQRLHQQRSAAVRA